MPPFHDILDRLPPVSMPMRTPAGEGEKEGDGVLGDIGGEGFGRVTDRKSLFAQYGHRPV